MRDYAECSVIAKRLRFLADDLENAYGAEEGESLFADAADAIEELLAERDQYKAYFDNVSSLPDCNVCLKQGVCEFVPAWGENTRINCPLALTEPPQEVE